MTNPNPYPVDVTVDITILGGVVVLPPLIGAEDAAVTFTNKRVDVDKEFVIPSHKLTWEWIPNYLPINPVTEAAKSAAQEVMNIVGDTMTLGLFTPLVGAASYATDVIENLKLELAANKQLTKARNAFYSVKLTTAFNPDETFYQKRAKIKISQEAFDAYKAYKMLVKDISNIKLADLSFLEPGDKNVVKRAKTAATKILAIYAAQVTANELYLKALRLSGLSGNG